MAVHTTAYEGRPHRRAFTRTELQALFDAADDHVEDVRVTGRKGWVGAFRDATMLKVAYAWGLRRRELRMLEVADFGPNPKADEFGGYGVCYGLVGGGDRRVGRGHLAGTGEPGRRVGPSERGPLVSEDRINASFARSASAAGLPAGLSLHCLRHSYVTHLIEDGFDPLFVQQQVGHEYASTTAIYTSVSSDYRTRVLRAALDGAVHAATNNRARR
jgi:site-specific recombinase XerD